MTSVPKLNLQLNRNKEISQCLELLASECDIPFALLTVLGEQQQFVRTAADFPGNVQDVFMPFLSRTSPELYTLYNIQWSETRTEEQKEAAPDCIKFYAGLPLITTTQLFLGSICLMDTQPRRLSAEQQELLTQIAGRIAGLLLVYQPKAAVIYGGNCNLAAC